MSAQGRQPEEERRRRRRQGMVVVGLLLTFAGLALIGWLLPVSPASLSSILPVAAGAALGLWVGGLLLGRAMGQRSSRRRE